MADEPPKSADPQDSTPPSRQNPEQQLARLAAELDQVRRNQAQAALQLKRQVATERIRNAALSMRRTHDLLNVVAVLWREMRTVGIATTSCSIQFIDQETRRIRAYSAFDNPRRHDIDWTSAELVELDGDIAVLEEDILWGPELDDFIARWRTGQVWSSTSSAHDLEALQGNMAEALGLDRPLPVPQHPQWVSTNVPFNHGIVAFHEPKLYPDHIALVQDCTQALDLGYIRFLDFDRLEEQNHTLEEANQQIQEANQLKSAFLARMSHDLRTPLNAIIGYTRILLRKVKGQVDTRQYRNLEHIRISADHLLSLINDILDLTKIEAGRIDLQPQSVELERLVGTCIDALAPLVKEGVELRQNLAPVGALRTDPDRVRRVLMNLLSNAVKFTEEGAIDVSLRTEAGQMLLAVADTGPGIPAAALPHIFDEFYRVESPNHAAGEGTGLGLAIARRSADLLGGDLSVVSQEGVGTTFTLKLPVPPG
ncbi:MAG: hypothetical protein GKR89_36540 [Candidatus Latescibacteria bacterium]|nr:hypothetical protein [Candidatus Latescibacterota bacterium]